MYAYKYVCMYARMRSASPPTVSSLPCRRGSPCTVPGLKHSAWATAWACPEVSSGSAVAVSMAAYCRCYRHFCGCDCCCCSAAAAAATTTSYFYFDDDYYYDDHYLYLLLLATATYYHYHCYYILPLPLPLLLLLLLLMLQLQLLLPRASPL